MNTQYAFSRTVAELAFLMTASQSGIMIGQNTVQAYYNPSSSNTLTAHCCSVDSEKAGTCALRQQISVTVTPQLQTNGHLHEGPSGYPALTRPSSTLSSTAPGNTVSNNGTTVSGTTDANDSFPVTISTGLVGQIEVLSGSCPGSSVSNAYTYVVGYNDLVVGNDPRWIPIGGSDTGAGTGHGTTANNQNMTRTTYDALVNTTNAWVADNPQRNCNICTNDAALPYGGKFDITAVVAYTGTVYPNDPVYGRYHPWKSPHSEHDRGSAVDIAATTNQCSHPVTVQKFLQFCKDNGFDQTSSIQEGNHVHCNSLPRGSFPH